ncbi:MFS transporter [Pseudalkalibacillus caeni]|uniref:MFS transporter n=1 Tax=Exobacillus caeni TaxID=2574798 RepID=A0A5R9F4B1_9BACL|nr:MFS transporter [Pseudalkalibacillus caeni]TLS37186.1 MFS transporter [Pseudalkalibacillus caeni]
MADAALKVKEHNEYPALKQNYPVFRFLGGNLISFLGDQIYLIAIPLMVLAMTGSPVNMGIVAALERLPVLLQPLTGILSDRFNRKHLLLVCDLGRCFLVGLIGALFMVDLLEIWFLYIGALLVGLFSQIYHTSQFAAVPGMVRREDLHEVNSIDTGIFNTAVLIGPGLGGLIISLYNPGIALLANSFSFLVAFLAVLSISLKEKEVVQPKRSFVADIKEGFQFVIHTKPILMTNLAMLGSVFGTTLFLTLMVFHLKSSVHFTSNQIGWLLSIGGVGAIAGALVTNQLRKRFSYRRILFLASTFGGLSIVLFGSAENFLWLVLFNMMGTIAASMMNPCIITIRQTLTPERLLGRVQATSRFMTWTLMPVAAFLAGISADKIGTHHTIILGGMISILASVFYLHPSLKDKIE